MKRILFMVYVSCFVLHALCGIDRAFFEGMLRIPSRCGDEAQLRRVVDYTRTWLENRGVWCKVETNEAGRVALYAATKRGEKTPDYLFVSHLDVVSAPDRMFQPRYQGDKVFARGACDTKGNAVVACQVLAELNGKASVGMFLATDEDGGGRGTATAAMMIKRGYIPRRLVLVGDSAGEEPGQLFVAEKGSGYLTLIAHGKGGHSSRPWALDNPAPKLFKSYLRFAEEWEKGLKPGEKWQTVLSPTILRGSSVGNIVPDTVTLTLSCRYTEPAEFDRAVKAVKAALVKGVELRASRGRPPVLNRPNDPEIMALLAAMKAKLPGGITEGRMSAATDASYYAKCGRPIVIFAATGGEPHCEREWGSLSSLDDYAVFFTDYLGWRRQ